MDSRNKILRLAVMMLVLSVSLGYATCAGGVIGTACISANCGTLCLESLAFLGGNLVGYTFTWLTTSPGYANLVGKSYTVTQHYNSAGGWNSWPGSCKGGRAYLNTAALTGGPPTTNPVSGWTFQVCPPGGAVCGNNIIEGSEVCDGSNLGGKTCQTQGYYEGSLSCTSCNIDTSNCHCGLPQPSCSKNVGACAGAKQVCSGGNWVDCTESDYQAHSSDYSILENTKDLCWDGADNDCNGEVDSTEPNCQPGVAALPPCDLNEMMDINDDGTVDSYDAIIMLRQIILYPNQFVGSKSCEAIKVVAQ